MSRIKNPKFREIALAVGGSHYPDVGGELLEKFGEMIVLECMSLCEQTADNADQIAKSEFVTDHGRMLHEGMWGGAKNCAVSLKQHFEIK